MLIIDHSVLKSHTLQGNLSLLWSLIDILRLIATNTNQHSSTDKGFSEVYITIVLISHHWWHRLTLNLTQGSDNPDNWSFNYKRYRSRDRLRICPWWCRIDVSGRSHCVIITSEPELRQPLSYWDGFKPVINSESWEWGGGGQPRVTRSL